MKPLRNPLANAHNHGAAGDGVDHWWSQRFSAILLVPLVLWLVWALSVLAGADFETASAWLASPWNAAMAILFVLASFYHGRLGLQVVIGDYIHHRPTELALQVLVAAGAIFGALIAVVSILDVAFAN
ncbi:succinate dehydrogenase, hydrophobic membrane anchor protein [Wenzhouxiangella sp. XN79A]|uniref:succinate dehydrogenase, hydrophobic membrane anchor protein n=1 Tax=Wenzhouxiangella sp. XN79A TaxID=2724193 RepID=UPI00144AF382|nr:succinate dehydrogenase, hydrophobic membrane anchor protein [Wenzhouxiangella sp. XN79A]NKI35471.1 succinate dehydrogenase, hydrophobic membrane anchor protein [Wenzhouxiangella sp. XN79A]